MCLKINEIPADGLRIDRTFEFVELAGDHDGRLFRKPLAFKGEIGPERGRMTLKGALSGSASLSCSRCLECYEQEISGRFRLVIHASSRPVSAGERQMAPSDALSVPAVDGRLELEALIREQCHLLLPLKPLCRPDCRGLCQTCGADRNRIECGCSSDEVDPRLAGLAEIKRNMPNLGHLERSPLTDAIAGGVDRGKKNDGESKA